MITDYRNGGKYDDAFLVFEQMQYAGVVPNRVMMVNAFSACASSCAIEMGMWIDDMVRRKGWELDVILGTTLIDMYVKCGRVEEGSRVFDNMKKKNAFTWNAVIKGLAFGTNGEEALLWFNRMQLEMMKSL